MTTTPQNHLTKRFEEALVASDRFARLVDEMERLSKR